LTGEPAWLADADRRSGWPTLTVVVCGLGRAGEAAGSALRHFGAAVTVLEASNASTQQARAERLRAQGATVLLGTEAGLPGAAQLLVASPGLPPSHPWLREAEAAQIPVWSAEQLAWHLRPTEQPAPWLTVSGTNGKTTTVQMLGAILQTAGESVAMAGNIGHPLVSAVLAEPPPGVLAVELSSFQLHFTNGLKPQAAALVNIGVDHLDWHAGMPGYIADKARVFDGAQRAVVFNADDRVVAGLVEALPDDAPQRIGFTLAAPKEGMVGVAGDVLVDRAFAGSERPRRLLARRDLAVPGDHNVANALAAAALALAHGVDPEAVGTGLRSFRLDQHRGTVVFEGDGIRYVDDSKATNVDSAAVSLGAYRCVVWVAGGDAKGARFDDLVREQGERLRGVVLLGRDRALVRDALRRHAPDVPVIEVDAGETEVMDLVVGAAAGLAAPGDTVLLAPACASTDQFSDYAARGDAFAAAVRRRARDYGKGTV
jgi:UDP-N-acetylmuramoylalanine--D-glutamate ligase